MKRLLSLLLLSIASKELTAQAPSTSVITHVTVVDVLTGIETKDRTVKMEDGKIASISASSAVSDGSPVETVDAHGGFLIPGLWDMHVHVHDTMELPLYIANGVTGIRVMSGDKDTRAFRARLTEQAVSPQIYLASAIVDGPNPMWPGSIIVRGQEDARKAVDEIKASGADFIKIYDGVPRAAYFALADEAKKQSIAFEGHLPELITAQEASTAGQRSIEHLKGIGLSCSNRQQSLMADLERAPFFRQKLLVEAEAFQSIDPAKCQTLFQEFRKNDTWQVPTLTVNRMWGRLDDSSVTRDLRLQYIDRASKRRWNDRTTSIMQRWGGADYTLARAVFAADERIVGAMFHSQVPMMAGTDAMNPYCLPGFSLHDELALLVESGLTPLAALQTATINPARFLDRLPDEGTIAPGKVANLVLLEADPLVNIQNTTHIEAVWLSGHLYNRQALDHLLSIAKQLSSK